MELREAWAAVRAGWWLVLVFLILGAGAATALVFLQTPLYTSTSELFVSTTGQQTTTFDALSGSQFSQERVASYARLITRQDFAERVRDRLGLAVSAETLQEEITATPVTSTVLIDVAVTDPSPQRAQQIAAAVDEEFASFVGRLEAPDGGGSSPVKVTVTDSPRVPEHPSSPRVLLLLAIGLGAGTVLGAALALVRARLDRTIKDPEAAAQIASAPLVGVVFRDDGLAKRHVAGASSRSRAVEGFRQLRNNLQFLSVDDPPTVVMVTSAVSGEGKSTVAINLAVALADAGRRVTLVEADLRRPVVADYLGLVGGAGLTNVLAGQADLSAVLQHYGERDLAVLDAGPTPPNPGELLASNNMRALLDKLRGENDVVVLDAAPLLPVADSSGLAVHMDGVLLVVRYGKTRTEQVHRAAALLAHGSARLLGVVVNLVPPRAEAAAEYGYGDRYARPAR